ncbi:MAG: hypothetical protein HYU64_21055 [Armatimonadetes bacterium]|nr:hypothetical protein [Armatimonadota bacterium]
MRSLLIVPIIHTEKDMGTLAGYLANKFIDTYGPEAYQDHVRTVEGMWLGIRNLLLKRLSEWAKVRLYQDGLPLCGREHEIVSQVAESGSENHRLLLELVAKGARLEGTEDPALLLEEYRFFKGMTEALSEEDRTDLVGRFNGRSDDLLRERDRYMASRISETLKEGETGILFVGLKHRTDEVLPEDIVPQYVIHRLPFKEHLEQLIVKEES